MKELIERPRPRAVFLGIDDAVIESVAELFPTRRSIKSLGSVNLADWDILIAGWGVGDGDSLEPVHLVSFADGEVGSVKGSKNTVMRVKSGAGNLPISVASQLAVPEAVPDQFAGLIRSLAEGRDGSAPHSCLLAGQERLDEFGGYSDQAAILDLLSPILITSDGYPIAALWTRQGGKRAISLPSDVNPDSASQWIRAAVEYLREVDIEAFPSSRSDWTRAAEWLTPAEIDAAANVTAKREAMAVAIENLQAEVQLAEQELADQYAKGDAGLRVLLTGTGDVLVQAVLSAIRIIGFDVRDMDAEWPLNDRREDLRVTDPDDPNWIAIAEVKGYGKAGPKAGDLISLAGRFSKRFSKEEGRDPSALWYVVNQRFETPPSDRPRRPGVEPGDLESFVAEGGLIVETVELFRISKSVIAGDLEPAAARRLMQGSEGWLTGG